MDPARAADAATARRAAAAASCARRCACGAHAGPADPAGDDGRGRHALVQLPGAAAAAREPHVARHRATYTALAVAMGIGSVAGALAAGARGRADPRLLVGAAAAFGVAELLVAAAPTIPLQLAALIPLGAVSVTFAAGVNSAMQLAVDPAMRGRVMALYSVVFLGSTPIGAPLVGWIAEVAGPRAGLLLGAAAALAAAVGGAIAFARAAIRCGCPRGSSRARARLGELRLSSRRAAGCGAAIASSLGRWHSRTRTPPSAQASSSTRFPHGSNGEEPAHARDRVVPLHRAARRGQPRREHVELAGVHPQRRMRPARRRERLLDADVERPEPGATARRAAPPASPPQPSPAARRRSAAPRPRSRPERPPGRGRASCLRRRRVGARHLHGRRQLRPGGAAEHALDRRHVAVHAGRGRSSRGSRRRACGSSGRPTPRPARRRRASAPRSRRASRPRPSRRSRRRWAAPTGSRRRSGRRSRAGAGAAARGARSPGTRPRRPRAGR